MPPEKLESFLAVLEMQILRETRKIAAILNCFWNKKAFPVDFIAKMTYNKCATILLAFLGKKATIFNFIFFRYHGYNQGRSISLIVFPKSVIEIYY